MDKNEYIYGIGIHFERSDSDSRSFIQSIFPFVAKDYNKLIKYLDENDKNLIKSIFSYDRDFDPLYEGDIIHEEEKDERYMRKVNGEDVLIFKRFYKLKHSWAREVCLTIGPCEDLDKSKGVTAKSG